MNESIKAVLILMVLGILIIPIISLDYVQSNSKEYILDYIESNFEYTVMDNIYINRDNIENELPEHIIHSLDWVDNATVIGMNEDGSDYDIEFGDNITYLGNNTYLIDISDFTYKDEVAIELNITGWNLSKQDTLIVYSNIDCQLWYYEGGQDMNNIDSVEINNGKYLMFISLNDKIDLLVGLDYNVLLVFDEPTENIEYQILIANEVNQSAFTLSDMTQYYIILSVTIVLSIFTIIFLTDFVDIIFDRKNKNKKR